MFESENLQFVPLTEKDFSLLLVWLRKPHVLEHWPNQLTDQEIRIKYQKHIASSWVFPFLVNLNSEPVAYIQSYQTWMEGNDWWPDQEKGTYGLDLYIGNEKLLNQGYGTRILRSFMQEFSTTHHVKKWVIDVDPKNQRAHRCYEKAGFRSLGIQPTPEGSALILELKIE